MIKSCKHIDIRDYKTLIPWVWDCISRHYARFDFKRMIINIGKIPHEDYAKAVQNHDKSKIYPAAENIAKYAAAKIAARDLSELPPVLIRWRKDNSTGKLRPIGRESALQQVFDYVAVHASMEIFDRRVVPQQVSSIPKRGPLHGAKIVQRWIQDDNRAMRYAKAHKIRYVSKCRQHNKADIAKCFPSAKLEVFMRLFRKDCANEDLIWLWETLLTTHRVNGYTGFMIGAATSQWAMQYMLSFVYRHVMSLFTLRRGKRLPLVYHMIQFMDDMGMTGTNRKHMKLAMRDMARYAKDVLELDFKPNWHIKIIDKEPFDMMGYVFHRNGKITIRARVFLRARNLILQHHREQYLTVSQARRLVSYKGHFKAAGISYIKEKKTSDETIQVKPAFIYAAKRISEFEKQKGERYESFLRRQAGKGDVYATADGAS